MCVISLKIYEITPNKFPTLLIM